MVRESRSPNAPTARDAIETRTTATMLAALFTGDAPGSPAVEQVAERGLVALGPPHVERAEADDLDERDDREQDPRQRHPEQVDPGKAGDGREEQGQQPERRGEHEQDAEGEAELAAHERGDVDLAEPGLLVDLGCDRDVAGARGRRAGARDADPRSRLLGRHDPPRPSGWARRTSRSRSARVWRRLTTSSCPPTTTVVRPPSVRHSVMWPSATSEDRWMRTNPASRHWSARVVSGTRTRWLSLAVCRRA